MRKIVIFGLGCAILLLGVTFAGAEEIKTGVNITAQDPVALGELWLANVDQQKYDKSWETASTYFKSAISKEQWIQTMALRGALGNLVSRKLKDKQQFTFLPGAPDGEYYVLTFNTAMKNKTAAVETLTMMKDKDGQWRAAGYFIR